MSPALIIAQLIGNVGLPLAISIIEKWSRDEPTNPSPREWLDLLNAPSLRLTYAEQIKAAEARKTGP
jgi:hypothetical protein